MRQFWKGFRASVSWRSLPPPRDALDVLFWEGAICFPTPCTCGFRDESPNSFTVWSFFNFSRRC
jgi:hypothetical protein